MLVASRRTAGTAVCRASLPLVVLYSAVPTMTARRRLPRLSKIRIPAGADPNVVVSVALARQVSSRRWREALSAAEFLHWAAVHALGWLLVMVLIYVYIAPLVFEPPHSVHLQLACRVDDVTYYQSEASVRDQGHFLTPPTLTPLEQQPCTTPGESSSGVRDVCFRQRLTYQRWQHQSSAPSPLSFTLPTTYRTLYVVTRSYSLRCSPQVLLFYSDPSTSSLQDLITGQQEAAKQHFPVEDGQPRDAREWFGQHQKGCNVTHVKNK